MQTPYSVDENEKVEDVESIYARKSDRTRLTQQALNEYVYDTLDFFRSNLPEKLRNVMCACSVWRAKRKRAKGADRLEYIEKPPDVRSFSRVPTVTHEN